MKTLYGYVVISPNGICHSDTYSRWRTLTIKLFMRDLGKNVTWKYFYRRGYRCVKAQIREGWGDD
jgi:hypothetical protein